ncbi:MAG: transcriptional coactivator p15/PC4 family protein [Dehalococcoidia bacterium]
MAEYKFEKNKSEVVHITPSVYAGYDVVNIRIYAKNKQGDWVPTRKGVTLNVDQIPELIRGLEWALQQPCKESTSDPPEPLLSKKDEDTLARYAYATLKNHGVAVHWDTAERIILKARNMKMYNKWQLHYVLATRKDLFKLEGSGCFKAL